jgi:glutathione S-transferase
MSSASPIQWALEELSIPHEAVRLDLQAGDQRKPEFLALNPMGQVPTLVDDGQPMFESSAIVIHLGDKYGVERGLWPAPTSAERMVALTWVAWSAVTYGGAIRLVFAHGEWAPEALRNAGQVERAMGRLDELLHVLDGHLAGREFLTGDTFTLADVYVSSAVGWSAGVVKYDTSRVPNVAAWLARSMARPAASVLGIG